MSILLPGEVDQAHAVDHEDRRGNQIAEDGLHPVLNLQPLAGIGFGNELVPAPAVALAAAEDGDDQGAEGQQVGGNDEIPDRGKQNLQQRAGR